jgi:[NiFe] hydrogenase diaphorase moiety large subunit
MLEVVAEFTEFFIEESCGWCAPCRVGTTLLKRMLEKVIEGRGTKADLADLENISNTIKAMSRCGLGQTAANPVLTTLKNMPEIYRARLKAEDFVPPFQIDKALADGIAIAGREPVWEEEL